MACIWLYLGKLYPCTSDGEALPASECTESWVYKNGFSGKPNHT